MWTAPICVLILGAGAPPAAPLPRSPQEYSWCVPVVHHYRVVSLSGSAVQRPGDLCVPTDSPALPACVWLAEALGYVVVPLRHAASRVGVPWYPACIAACLDVLRDALPHSRPANRASACTAS